MSSKMGNPKFYADSWSLTNDLLRSLLCGIYIPILVFFIAEALSGCSSFSGPQYQRPETEEKTNWSRETANSVSTQVIRPDWWRNFNDPYLDSLIEQALTSNLDLKILAARTGVAAAGIDQANAARLPTIDAALGANYQKSPSFSANTRNSYAAALTWEVDIWGKLKKGVSAQRAGVHASEAEWRAGFLTLIADVATSYFQIRQFDEQIDQQRRSLETSKKIVDVYESQLQDGLVPQTQVFQQQAEVSLLNTDLLELQRLRKLAENTLSTLLAVPAGNLSVPKQHLSDTVSLIAVPAALPSDLLVKRPDIIAAEYRVLQAYELEGQAKLARLPSLSLTSNVGSTSDALSNLVETWSFGLAPTLSIPIFDPGVKARYKVSQAESELTKEQYRKTVMRAFEEVESTLISLSSRQQQHKYLLDRKEKLDIVSLQVQARLEEGMISQLQVFESERELLSAKLKLLANHRLILEDTVLLYKALGGGWPKEVVEQGSG